VRISVLMAVHNGGADLSRTLDSLAAALPPDCEVVVVDDGSTDATPRILAERDDLPLVVLRQERAGQTRALNHGLQQARGEFVARMDCGDFCHPERLLRQATTLEAQPRLLALGCRVRRLDKEGRLLGVSDVVREPERIARGLLRINLFQHSALMLRREALLELGGYRPFFRFSQDLDLTLRLSERGPLGNLDEALSDWVLDPDSVSFRHRGSQAAFARIARCCALARRRGEPDPVDAGTQPPPSLPPEGDDARLAAFHLETARSLLMGDQADAARKELARARVHGLSFRHACVPEMLAWMPASLRRGLRRVRVGWITR